MKPYTVKTNVTNAKNANASNTKRESYRTFIMDSAETVDENVFNYLKEIKTSKSRSQITSELSLRTQTVCGVINRLMHAGRVKVKGTIYDQATNRNVQAIVIA
jgi:hypothetical protein